VVIGPECTGKSTLSKALASALHTVWTPEYAREYLESIDRPYNEDDLLAIAQGQLQSEDTLAQQANRYLICDTDLQVIKVWSEHKYKRLHPWIQSQIAERHYALYLLTYIDVPWQYDALREHPDESMRQYFYDVYKALVRESGVPWMEIKGDENTRLKKALEAIKRLN